MENLQQIFTQFTVDLITAGATLLLAYTINAVRRASMKAKLESEKIENEEQRQLVNEAIIRLEDVTTKTVTKLEQTTAKELRELVKDGKIEKSELQALSQKALDEIISSLKPDYMKLIEDTFGDARSYILNTIESKVFELKNTQG